jgi:NADPH-dependent glutamate synthase beta subunit-like oxidoreductase
MCPEGGRCEFEKMVDYIGIKEVTVPSALRNLPVQAGDPLFERDYNLCVLCGRCVRYCQEVRGVGAIEFKYSDDGSIAAVGPVTGQSYLESGCKFCGACVEVCPTAALRDKQVTALASEREADLIPCRYNCPAEVDIPRFVCLVQQERFAEAAAVLREKLTFPAVLGRVCHHPCEKSCRRGQLNQPLAVKALKRLAVEHDTRLWRANMKAAGPTGRSVAVIGAGPAGLTAAFYLARLGHAVTVFEALSRPGGMMRAGIPAYRLPRDVLDGEIEIIKDFNVDIKTGVRVTSLDSLFDQGYHAVFVAVGAHRPVRLDIEGEDAAGVVQGIEFLRQVNLGERVSAGKRVAVIGGGNVAVDAARVALRLGSEEVAIIYRRTRKDMPAIPGEVAEAEAEGVKLLFYTAPVSAAAGGGVINLDCIRLKPGKKWDSKGRRLPEPVPGSKFTLSLDAVIVAAGQQPEIPPDFNLESDGNAIVVDPETLATNRRGVFAGGDAATGPASVVEAVAAGRKAAGSIDRYLGGAGVIDGALAPSFRIEPWLGKEEDFAGLQRIEMPLLSPGVRRHSFAEIEQGFDREMAVKEAHRCLKCSLRLQITPVMAGPE